MNELISLYRHLQSDTDLSLPKTKTTLTIPHYPTLPTTLSPRKTHEISQMVGYITDLHNLYQFDFLIDVGSGGAHLSRALNMRLRVPIVCVEEDMRRVCIARRMDRMIGVIDLFYVRELNSVYGEEVQKFIGARKKSNCGIARGFVIGLDVCGDLGTEIVEFIKTGHSPIDIIGCCFVACCFHKCTRLLTIDDYDAYDVLSGLTKCSDQDIRALTEDEIMQKYQIEAQDESIEQWRLEKGPLSSILESIVHQDRMDALQGYNVSKDIMFDYTISSRNVSITAIRR